MHRLVVIAIAAGITAGVFLTGAFATGCSGADASGVERGQKLAEENCGRCHKEAQRDALVARRTAGGEPVAILDAFLKAHHMPDADQRAALVAFLTARIAAR